MLKIKYYIQIILKVLLIVKKKKKFILKGLHALINNAGIATNCSWDDWLTLQQYENILQVNALGIVRVTHAFKNLIKKAKFKLSFNFLFLLIFF